jgi:hypothetical protein
MSRGGEWEEHREQSDAADAVAYHDECPSGIGAGELVSEAPLAERGSVGETAES